ncbi:MAG: PASTA domain-containing protein [Nitrospirae bacterium]|nr:PASTA domain-containing protein [Nitrospirota bacterium]
MICVTLLIFAALFIGYRFYNFNKASAPSLSGKSVEEARKLLEPGGLALIVEREVYDDEIPKGGIIEQDIAAGEKAASGEEIKVTVSLGPEIFSMPSFEGQVLEEAKLTLDNLGIRVGKVTKVHSDSLEEGRIIAQRPLPGNVRSNSINFVVSLGPYDIIYRCPSFVDMHLDEAERLAGMLGLKLAVQEEGDVVIYQKPDAGERIKRGDSVEVTLGRPRGIWF